MGASVNAALEQEIGIPLGRTVLGGNLTVPVGATGLVVFAHGSGSSRFSPRNRFVAGWLNRGGLGTLLFDLLTEIEVSDRARVFDIPLLARRLTDAVRWLETQPLIPKVPLGLFGASTGAAAALVAAASLPTSIRAVVSRGGRPDLAGDALTRVLAPTLLIVGGDDRPCIGLNRAALSQLTCPKEMVIVPGAGHLFEEAGTLEQAATLAAGWFTRHLESASPIT
jgi:pimeloyl-ACP methyl ester carboxylesterase